MYKYRYILQCLCNRHLICVRVYQELVEVRYVRKLNFGKYLLAFTTMIANSIEIPLRDTDEVS